MAFVNCYLGEDLCLLEQLQSRTQIPYWASSPVLVPPALGFVQHRRENSHNRVKVGEPRRVQKGETTPGFSKARFGAFPSSGTFCGFV